MITDWIDDLCAVWAIQPHGFQTVRSYFMLQKAEFPESVELKELAEHPVALTFWPDLQPEYSAGGPLIGYWYGETEFHLAPDFKKERVPEMLPWYKHVLAAAAGHAKLGGKVELFVIVPERDAMVLTSLQYGEEAKHWGLVVRWIVKERLEGEFTVSP